MISIFAKHFRLLGLLAILLAILLAGCERAQEFEAQVVSVADGDTVTVVTGDGNRTRIRLAQIDAPEHGQAFAGHATRSLREMVQGRSVRIVVEDIDQYGRTVARIHLGELDVNAEQVRRGMAWVYRRYATDTSLYALEDVARETRAGLWSGGNPVPPWQYRWRQRNLPETASD